MEEKNSVISLNQQTIINVMGNRINSLMQDTIYLEARCVELEQRVMELEAQLNSREGARNEDIIRS
jgi:hypothetical protein